MWINCLAASRCSSPYSAHHGVWKPRLSSSGTSSRSRGVSSQRTPSRKRQSCGPWGCASRRFAKVRNCRRSLATKSIRAPLTSNTAAPPATPPPLAPRGAGRLGLARTGETRQLAGHDGVEVPGQQRGHELFLRLHRLLEEGGAVAHLVDRGPRVTAARARHLERLGGFHRQIVRRLLHPGVVALHRADEPPERADIVHGGGVPIPLIPPGP